MSDVEFIVNPAAKQFLNGVKGPISVIAIAGKYRGGKSFIINNLIGRPGCFVVGSETTACTQGLWIWNKAIPI